LMTLLGKGPLRLGGGSSRNFQIEGGFLQVIDNVVRIVTEKATAA
jgi:F-type H+-transporting ATPase subunit epsilon